MDESKAIPVLTEAAANSEAADALNYMALAGYDAEKSMTMLPNVLNLAAAGGKGIVQRTQVAFCIERIYAQCFQLSRRFVRGGRQR